MPRPQRLTGRSKDQLVGIDTIETIHPDDRGMILERRERAAQGLPHASDITCRLLRPDGTIVWVEISYADIEWHGRSAIMGTISDISLRKEASDTLEQNRFWLEKMVEVRTARTARRQGRGRRRQPGQGHLPGQHEPRDPHPAERHPRPDLP